MFSRRPPLEWRICVDSTLRRGRWAERASEDDEADSPKTTAAKAAEMARLTRQELEEQRRRDAKSSASGSSGLLRSERMIMVQLIVQHDAAQLTVEELGQLGSLMFVDLNEGVSAFRRNFLPELRRCDEAERALRYIGEAVSAAGLTPSRVDWRDELRDTMGELLAELDESVIEIGQLKASQRELTTDYNALVELSHVLQKCDAIFSEARAHGEQVGGVGVPSSLSYAELVRAPSLGLSLDGYNDSSSGANGSVGGRNSFGAGGSSISLGASWPDDLSEHADQLDATDLEFGACQSSGSSAVGLEGANRLGYICGVVDRARLPAFERVLFRATRGNMFMRTADVSQLVRDPTC